MTHHLGKLVFGAVLSAVVAVPALAQVAGASVLIDCGQTPGLCGGDSVAVRGKTQGTLDSTMISWEEKEAKAEVLTTYISHVHNVVLRGIPLPDRATAERLRQVVFRQADEIYRKAARGLTDTRRSTRGSSDSANAAKLRPTAAELETTQKHLFEKLLPELRALLPATQQAAFDQSLRALQESNYRVALVAPILDKPGKADTIPQSGVSCFGGCPLAE